MTERDSYRERQERRDDGREIYHERETVRHTELDPRSADLHPEASRDRARERIVD